MSQDQTGIPRTLDDSELDAVLAAAGRELIAEIEHTTDTAMHREEILRASPQPSAHDGKPAISIPAEEPPRRGIRAAIANFLIFLTGADRRFLTFAIDRQRHTTMGMLMLITTGLAFYAGTTVAAMGFARPFSHEIGYGAFFSLFVFFIDRSIVGYVTPARAEDADSRPARGASSRWAPWPRILIAIAASFLLSEVIVLQLFAARINQQLAVNHVQSSATISRQAASPDRQEITLLQSQITAANAQVTHDQARVDQDMKTVSCQLYGCAGTPAGNGPLTHAAQAQLVLDQGTLSADQQRARSTTTSNNERISVLQDHINSETAAAEATVASSNDMLAREQALQQITSGDSAILILRIILWLVLVGIDLTPVIIKITTSTGVYEERIRSQILIATQNTREIARRQVSRIKMETEIDKQEQRLDYELAQAMLAKKAGDLHGAEAHSSTGPT